MDIAFFYVLTLYFDQVIANEYGVRRPLWYPFLPSYWGIAFGKNKNTARENSAWLAAVKLRSGGYKVEGNQDAAVLAEQELAQSETAWPAVKVVNLRKVFKKYRFRRSKLDKTAVKDVSVTFEEGKLLALLGQNGAGKSTTMNMLSGLTKSTRGDALVYGYSVDRQMSDINKLMGGMVRMCIHGDGAYSLSTA